MSGFGSFELRTVENKLRGASGRVLNRLELVVEGTATNVEHDAKVHIVAYDLIDTGALLNSVQAIKLSRFVWMVEVGQYYGIYHEYGTVLLPARPFLGPSVDLAKTIWPELIRQAIEEGIG